MTVQTIALALALLAWLLQFVAWRREVVARQQLELQVEKLQAYLTVMRHPALRNRDLEGGTDA